MLVLHRERDATLVIPRLEAMRHAHAVLDMEERGQQALEIEMRHAVEIGFLADVVGPEHLAEGVEDAVALEPVPADLVA